MPENKRCSWAKDELNILYHDTEWGKPEHDDAKLFEFLILEGMQAGLSWSLILKRRENMRRAFDNFDYHIIAEYGDEKKQQLLQDPGVIRNRRKIDALVANAQAFIAVQQEFGSFDAYIWGFVGGKPLVNHWQKSTDAPATSELSDAMSKDLRRRGFKFVGSTICYSFMQAMGLINDHEVGCPRHLACQV